MTAPAKAASSHRLSSCRSECRTTASCEIEVCRGLTDRRSGSSLDRSGGETPCRCTPFYGSGALQCPNDGMRCQSTVVHPLRFPQGVNRGLPELSAQAHLLSAQVATPHGAQ